MSSNLQQWHGGIIDETLTKEGIAAGAKAVGDALGVLDTSIGSLKDHIGDLKSAFDSTLNKISKTENVALGSSIKRILNNVGNISTSNKHALLYKISVVGISQITVTSARYASWTTNGPLIAFYSTDVSADIGENTCVGVGTIHSGGDTYTETYAIPSTAVCAYVQSCDTYGDPTVITNSIKILEDVSSLENIVGKETVGTFTKTGTSNATKYIAHPIAGGQTLIFMWETDGGSTQSMNLFTRNSSSGENIETVKSNAHPNNYYTFTATAEAAGLFLSATASGTIHVYVIGTVVGNLKNIENQVDNISKKTPEQPFVQFSFSDIMYDPSDIFASDGEIGQIATWESKTEALSKVHAAFDALCASSNGYGMRIQNLYKEAESDEAQFDIIAPSYVTNGVTQGETVTLNLGTDTSGNPVTYLYTYESSTEPYEVRLYKFQETNNALQTENVNIPKKKLLLIGGTHGNEFCAPINLYVFAKHLCTDYSNPDMLKLRSAFDVYIIPYLNGFGCMYKWNNQGYISTGSRSNGHMVDINRNCETNGWVGATGTAEQITSNFESKIANLGVNTFPGASAGSEFESKLVKAIVEWIQPNVVIDHHHNDGSSPIYAMAYDRTGGMQIYQAVNDIAYAYMKNFPEYYGNAYNLFLSSTVSPASLTAKNGYVTTMTGEMGVQMSATEEMPEAIAWSNGAIDSATKTATRYSANAFETAEYTLLCVVLHLCQYAMEH